MRAGITVLKPTVSAEPTVMPAVVNNPKATDMTDGILVDAATYKVGDVLNLTVTGSTVVGATSVYTYVKSAVLSPVVTPPVIAHAWPDATNTGYLGDPAKLKNVTQGTVTVAGTILDGLAFTGNVLVNAPNVTIRNCVITGGNWGIEIGTNASGLIIQDCTFIGGDNCAIMDDYNAPNVTLQRLNISGSVDGIKLGGPGRTVRDNFIHSLGKTATSHNDGIQASSGSNWLIEHNWIESNDTGCISMFEGQGVWDGITIRGNRFVGGGYSLYLGGNTAKNVTVTGNIISGSGYGPWTDQGTAVFAGNTDPTGKPIN